MQVRSVVFDSLQTIVCQATLSMEFSSKNPEMGCRFLLQGIFPTRGLKLRLLHWKVDSLPLSHLSNLSIATFVNNMNNAHDERLAL